MILRRLARSLRDQNWTTITIEFVLLVLGVFLGIQAANWNAAVIERREARAAMLRLEADLRLSVELTDGGIASMAENARQADLVFERLRTCTLPEAERDDFANGLYRLGKSTTARYVRTTFDELRDSGRLGFLGDAGLRQALDEAARRQELHEVVFRLIMARTDPHMAYIENHVIWDIGDASGGYAQIGWNRVDIDFDAACRDRRFRAAVGAMRNYGYDVLSDVTALRDRFAALLVQVEQENSK